MIYTIPLRNSVDNIVIKPEINLKKAMTADLGNKAALFDSFELPEQLYTITRNSIDKNAFTIRKSFNDDVFLSDENSLYFSEGFDGESSLWKLNYQPLLRHNVITNNIDDNKAVDVPGGVTANGTHLIMYSKQNLANQRFLFSESSLGERTYIVSSLSSSKVISSESNSSDAIIYTKDSGVRQAFVLLRCDDKGKNVFQILNIWSDKILAWNATNGVQVFFHKNEYKDEHY